MKKVSIHESKLIRGGSAVQLIVGVEGHGEPIKVFGLVLPNDRVIILSDTSMPKDVYQTVVDGIMHSQ